MESRPSSWRGSAEIVLRIASLAPIVWALQVGDLLGQFASSPSVVVCHRYLLGDPHGVDKKPSTCRVIRCGGRPDPVSDLGPLPDKRLAAVHRQHPEEGIRSEACVVCNHVSVESSRHLILPLSRGRSPVAWELRPMIEAGAPSTGKGV